MSTARDDDELEPLPEDFVIPDDASALARDRAAHRMSGLPSVDPILIRVILTLVIGFLCTFAMFMVVTSKQMICANETECAAAALSPLQTGLVLFTPLITAAAALLALKAAEVADDPQAAPHRRGLRPHRLRRRLLHDAVAPRVAPARATAPHPALPARFAPHPVVRPS